MAQSSAILLSVLLLLPALAVYYLSRKAENNGNGSGADKSVKKEEAGPLPQISPEEFRPFKLTRKEPVSHNTNLYRFALDDPTLPLGLLPGQHIQVRALIDGVEAIKPYTPISLFETKGYFDLLIKTYPQGRISRYMDGVKTGESVLMRGPKGSFQYVPNGCRRIGMIGGGTGITPLLSVCRAVLGHPDDRSPITLIFANKSPEDCLLESELKSLESEFPGRFRVCWTVDLPNEKWDGEIGLVTESMIQAHLPSPSEDCKILICGPPLMMTMVVGELKGLGYPDDKVFRF